MKPSKYFKDEMNKLNEEFTYEIGVLERLDKKFIDAEELKKIIKDLSILQESGWLDEGIQEKLIEEIDKLLK